ncbi:MAG: WD40 repeat domain-containing protein [Alphaproteobacteria bacterium]|nr:WD40 repeat domain-containing protein [Alphaproteobacteria bacterium]
MSQAAPARFLANDAYVTGLAYAPGVAAFALGDGTVKLVADDGGETVAAAHDGAALCLAVYGDGFVSGGDDGRLVRIGRDGSVTELLKLRGKFIEHVAVSPASGALVCAAGRDIFIIAKPGAAPAEPLSHRTSVTGLAFDPKGKRIACAHYNGVSLWWLASETATLLDWKGSHVGVWWHPGGDFVMTAMQENALHGWRLSDKQHMRMAGYPAKTKSMAWFSKGKWLATAGSEAVICWPFDGKGPMGKSAREIGPQGSICTVVAPHPNRDLIASGHADGSVWLTRFEDDKAACVRAPAATPVSALTWRPDGNRLAFGCEDGAAGILNFEGAAG